jgi:Tfp pilus assembly protein PilX
LLLVVLVLLGILLAASMLALHSMRSDTASARNERQMRQLFDCAERALQIGKTHFSQTSVRADWDSYLKTNVCSTLPCGPFPTGQTGAGPGGYPTALPFAGTQVINANISYDYKIGAYNNPGDPSGIAANGDNMLVVYAVCTDAATTQSRAVQALINVPLPKRSDYFGQSGMGFQNQGNSNNAQ